MLRKLKTVNRQPTTDNRQPTTENTLFEPQKNTLQLGNFNR